MKEKYSTDEFLDFFYEAFRMLFPAKDLVKCGYINLIADRLIGCLNNKINRFIINIPPRHMKSLIVNVAFPAFIIGKRPDKCIISASYSGNISAKHSVDTKTIMLSNLYKQRFKDTIICPKQNNRSRFVTTKFGFRFATSVGGSLTGEGADIVIADDPISALQCCSKQFRDRVKTWFLNTLMPRLNNRSSSSVIIVMQRLHEDDLCGYLIKNSKDWSIISLPIIAEKDKQFFSLNTGDLIFERRMGSTLNEYFASDAQVQILKREIGSYVFFSQYQQKPIINEKSIIKSSWIRRYDHILEIQGNLFITQSWDTAISTKNNSDYSVCITFAKSENYFYILDVLRKKISYSDLKTAIVENTKKWNANCILIENKSSGQILIQDLHISSTLPVIGITPVLNKVDRLYKVISIIEANKLYLPNSADWLSDFESELFSFPDSINDDQVDSLTQYLNYELGKDHSYFDIKFL